MTASRQTASRQTASRQTASHSVTITQSTASAAGLAMPDTALLAAAGRACGQILTVGAGEEYSSLSAAVAAARNGDTVMVKAGTYVNDFADVTSAITIESFGGVAHFVATEAPSNLKGILTVDNSCTIEGLSFSGAAISAADGGNAAGIRYEGGAMVLKADSFSNNQDGVMGTPVIQGLAANTVTIEDCLFDHNGDGDGYTHNCYIGTVTSLVFTNNISEGAVVGHELKSRAYANTIENNIFRDGAAGTASYEIDLPNGGVDVVANNRIEKGPNAQNEVLVHFGGEGIPYAGSSLLVEGNTFINAYGQPAIAVLNQTASSVTITGNIFRGFLDTNIAQGPAVESNNTNGAGKALPNTTLTGLLPGNTVIFTDSNAHSITLGGSITAVEGGGGMLTVSAVGGHVIAVGGAGGMHFTETGSSGGNTMTTAAGSANTLTLIGQDVIASAGTDTIQAGSCNLLGAVSGSATIFDGTGNNQWDVSGHAAITGQGGNPVVSVAGGGTASIGGTVDFLYVENNGGAFALDVGENGWNFSLSDTGGAVDATVAGATLTVATANGPTGATMTLGAGNAVVTSAGPDTIHAGSGSDTVIVEGAAQVYAGSGSLSVFGRSDPGGASVYGDGGTVTIAGDTGNIIYEGGALANTVEAQLYNIVLNGGAGRMRVLGGSDNVIHGGSGGLVYTAVDGGGADRITTMAGARDTLSLAASDNVVSYGNDLIDEGSGNQTLSVHGTSTIEGGTGNNFVTLSGVDILDGVGQDFVTVTTGATAIIAAGTNTVVTENGASLVRFTLGGGNGASVSVQGGAASVQGGSASGAVQVSTTAGTSTQVTLGAGNVTVTSGGTDTVIGGSGSDMVSLNGGSASVAAGSGAMTISSQAGNAAVVNTITGGSGALSYTQNGATLQFIGGTGSSVINGGSGALYITGGAGQIAAAGGTGGFDFTGGTGVATLQISASGGEVEFGAGSTTVAEAGWGGGVTYDFAAGHGGGQDVISGFRAGVDSADFNGVSVAKEVVSGGNTSLTLSDATQVLLVGFADTGHLF